MEEWKEYKLGDLYDVHNGLSKGSKFFGSGYPFLSFKTVFNNYFLPPVLSDMVQSNEKEQNGYDIKRGDVFVTRTSETPEELGMSSVALRDYPSATYNGFTKRLRPKGMSLVYPEFIGYYLRSPKFRAIFYGLACSMSTRASLANGDLLKMRIFLPSFETQVRIASILSSLDSKIDLNRRINDNLEQQAQALFKAWFVDSEPFKNGEFVDDDFGRRPSGWYVKPLEYLVEKVKSGDWGKDEQIGNYIKRTFCMRGADFPNIKEGNKGKMPIRYILEKNFNEKSLNEGSVVVEISGGSPTQSTGRIVLIDKTFIEECDNALICTNFCKSLEIKEGYSVFFYLLWQYLYDQKVMFIYENGSNGLKNLNINSLIERELFTIPPKDVISKFNLAVSSLLSKKQANGAESSRLASIRDTLLPKLMSGELKINS